MRYLGLVGRGWDNGDELELIAICQCIQLGLDMCYWDLVMVSMIHDIDLISIIRYLEKDVADVADYPLYYINYNIE